MSSVREIHVSSGNPSLKGPLLLTGFFESTLKQHFFTPDSLFDDSLKDILWRPKNDYQGTTDTNIYIGYTIKANSKKANFRPAILIERGEWKREKIAMYDRDGLGDIYYGDKTDRWRGSHSFKCLSKTLAGVELLGHEVATFFEIYGQLLADQICLEELFVTAITPPVIIQEDNETYGVTVTVNYYHHNRWSLAESRPKIRHIRPLITIQDFSGKFEPKTTLVDIQYDG